MNEELLHHLKGWIEKSEDRITKLESECTPNSPVVDTLNELANTVRILIKRTNQDVLTAAADSDEEKRAIERRLMLWDMHDTIEAAIAKHGRMSGLATGQLIFQNPRNKGV